MLSATPDLAVFSDPVVVDEGQAFNLVDIGTFTDVVEGTGGGGGDSIGLNPDDFTPFDPDAGTAGVQAFDPAANVLIDTTNLTIDGVTAGTFVTVDAGSGSYEIAVFTFAGFELDAGITLTATGSRPLALLSQGDMTVNGIIDVSAQADSLNALSGQHLAGPGGGNGGDEAEDDGGTFIIRDDGDAAAGAPAESAGRPGNYLGNNLSAGGAGGGHGGRGGNSHLGGDLLGETFLDFGAAFGDLSLGIQGGSGGGNGNGDNDYAGGGGGGGIELGATGTFTIGIDGLTDVSASVLADGGNGESGGNVGGGGGAGGGILVHAPTVKFGGMALLSAAGGNGGNTVSTFTTRSPGGGGGGGDILVAYSDEVNSVFDDEIHTDTSAGSHGDSAIDDAAEAGPAETEILAAPQVPVIENYSYTIDWGDSTGIDSGSVDIDVAGVDIGDLVEGSFDGYHTYAQDGVYTVTVSVISDTGADASETTDTETFTITVNNVDPVITSLATDSTDVGGAAAGDTVNLSAAYTDEGVLDTHTVMIDWGDGSTPEAGTVDQLTGTVSGSHVYTTGGIFEVTVTLSDGDGGVDVETTRAVVAGVGLNNGVLQIVGTNNNDFAKVYKSWYGNHLKVLSNIDASCLHWQTFDLSTVTEIEMLLGDGHDLAFVSSRVHLDASIDGGNGDDILAGGSGNDVLLGGDGYDVLMGRGGRDLMIGGLGSDYIIGNGGEDILVAGTTAYDGDAAALDAIMAEWTSDHDFDTRVANITASNDIDFEDRHNGEFFLIGEGEDATVFDDEAADLLLGGSGLDLYFANLSGGVEDFVFDFSASIEELEEVDV